MTATTASRSVAVKTPLHLWFVGTVAVLWNAVGVFDYLMKKLEVSWYMAEFTPTQIEYFANYPAWATAFWAIGVWCALGGSIAILLRSQAAVPLYAFSLIGLAGTTVYTNFMSDGMAAMDGFGYVLFSLAIWVILVGLLLYSLAMRKRGVLR